MAVTLEFDGTIEKLATKAKQVKVDLEGIADSYEKIGEAERMAIGGATAGQEKLDTATKKTGSALKEQSKTIENLEDRLKRLAEGQRKANNPETVKKYNTEIAKTEAALKLAKGQSVGFFTALRGGATVSQAAFLGLKSVLASTFAPLFAVTAVIGGLREVISLVNGYEQTAADLAAITGASGDTLEYLKQQAVEVGVETTISAGKTLEAYKLIASAKPELLQNAEGLAAITREAVTLTEAMGGDLPDVASNLTDIMNQFNAPASEAGRFVNALAAGSKEGSAEVAQLAESIKVSGQELKSSNVQFEEGVGLLEAMAEKGLKGAEAGTGLRNVLSKLSATDVLPKEAIERLEAAGVNIDQLSDKNLTFADRLKALLPVQNDANALVSVFGLENKAAAQILLGNIGRVEELTAAVTGTNVAQEQAVIRTATASGEWERFKNTISAVIQDNGGGLSGFLALIIRFVREGVLFLKAGMDSVAPAFRLVGEAVGRLFAAMSQLLPATKGTGEGLGVMEAVAKALGLPLKILLTLFSFLVDALAAVVQWFGAVVQRSAPLQAVFAVLQATLRRTFEVFADLPAYVEGALSAVRVFVTETGAAIGQLGDNIGRVLSEAFNIKKLIAQGTDDLTSAVDRLLVNPFKDIGAKSAKAFADGFAASKASAPTPKGQEAEPQTAAEIITTQSFSRSGVDADKEAEKAAKEAERLAKEAEKLNADIARAKIEALQDGVEKELALEQLRYDDLRAKLEKYGVDATQATVQHEINKYNIRAKFIEEVASLEELSGQERIKFVYDQAKAEIEALETSLRANNGGELLESQAKQLNLLRKEANDKYLTELEAFQSKEQQQAQAHEIALLELKSDEFKTAVEFEEFKQKEILDIRLKYAEAQLALLEQTQGAESDAALALKGTINGIKKDIESLTKKGAAKSFSIYELVGLNPDDPKDAAIVKGVQDAAKAATDVISQVNAARLESAQQSIDASNAEIEQIQKEIEEKEKQLDYEIGRSDKGYASKQIEVQQEIDLLKQQQEAEKVERDKALKEKQRIQRQQAIVDSVTQASSLITAAAQIFQSVAAIPFVGVAIGAALVAAMVGGFIATKAKVFQSINKQKAEKGMYGVVKGKRHYEGGERFGDHIEVEHGEAFGVLSRQATRAHGAAYEAFTNAANRGDRAAMAKVAQMWGVPKLDRTLPDTLQRKDAKIVQMKTEVNAVIETEALRENNRLLKAGLAERNKPQTEYLPDRTVTKTGQHVRVIKKRKTA